MHASEIHLLAVHQVHVKFTPHPVRETISLTFCVHQQITHLRATRPDDVHTDRQNLVRLGECLSAGPQTGSFTIHGCHRLVTKGCRLQA